MKCNNCGTDNAANESFCSGCGSPLETNQAPAASNTPPAASATAQGPVVLTLTFDGQDYPLYEGQTFLIAYEGSTVCKPDLPMKSDTVSSTPVELRVEGGVVKVKSDKAFQVTKTVESGTEIELLPGEMLLLGEAVIIGS